MIALALALLAAASEPARQVEADNYTRYELLAPGSGKFRIVYEVTNVTPGATAYFNPIRPGSIATDESVTDRATGKPLKFGVVSGDVAAKEGLPGADPKTDFIRVQLARPVPADGGEGRVLIDKTYEDAKSYHLDGDTLVFDRPLGVKRNSVVLPKGYELLSSNVPSQIIQQPDGRIAIAFWNDSAAQAPLVLKAKRAAVAPTPSSMAKEIDERAHQNREIVYFLNPPETHSFFLYHDYTEETVGTGTYVNIVRTGSAASGPSGRNLDTGETLKWEMLKGDAILKADPHEGGVTPETEAVVFRFAPVKAGESKRLRFSETYTDPVRYTLVGDELVWHRSFGRPANAIVLPAGWVLTNSSVPATVSQTGDGRTRLDYLNPRPGEIDVVVTARRRAAS